VKAVNKTDVTTKANETASGSAGGGFAVSPVFER
jgi:hypothetical protein